MTKYWAFARGGAWRNPKPTGGAYILQYDREKPREVTEAPHEAGSTAPSPERQLAARQEPEKQSEQTPEVAMGR